MKKKCSCCQKLKDISNFSKNRTTKDGLQPECKKCCSVRQGIYRKNNKLKIKKNRHNYYLEHKKLEIQRAIYWQNKNKEKVKKYREMRWPVYYSQNKESFKKRAREFTKNNRDYINNRNKIKRKTNIEFKILGNLRNRINQAVKNDSKLGKTSELLGCSVDYFKKHIQNKFQYGMNWNNWSIDGWHIDHIYPCSSFNLKKKSEQLICFHWSNQQPMWAKENLEKSDKI
jgi:phosphoglycerate-specific signal transduction histidine kinase